ncbi:serum response factor-binding protein 1 [Phycodurus eques]|uniref:serum response factor-binding protein 1 n=1 Tax=Phycodurus eques TaxID=693459 RepID=UPI002ACD944A|nr:serum response factor-binding protein 1 [Phycodurus eques]
MTTSNDSVEEMACEKEEVGKDSRSGDIEGDNKEQKKEDVREGGGEIEDGKEKKDGGESEHVEGEDCSDDKEEEEEAAGQPTDKTEKKPDQVEVKNQPEVLNLNNEVVNMRKEVKRVRALLSRKLIRQITGLKKKKGNEADIEKNHRRAARLLEEIHAMKVLRPDLVTKTALQKNLNFNEVCKNPKSTMSDRAIARIASHPQFKKKIENIQAAVKAFRDERRRKGWKQGEQKVKNEAGKVALHSPDVKPEKVQEMVKEENYSEEVRESPNDDDSEPKDQTSSEPDEDKMESTQAAEKKVTVETKIVKPASVKKSEPKEQVRPKKPEAKTQENKPKVVPESTKEEEEESELDLSDEEDKPYFDDSTEERFHKQSSQEESESDNDFFVGKVSKLKKKKSKNTEDGDKSKEDSAGKLKTADKVQGELDELESRLKAKEPKLQTVFCSLSQTKPSRGGRGKPFRGQGKPMGRGFLDSDKRTKFQKEEKGPTGHNKYYGPDGKRSDSERRNFRGRGRGDATRQQDRRGPGGFSHQAPQQALHPSWEASKKRKEQQGQIMAFQGKKIKFDDDD